MSPDIGCDKYHDEPYGKGIFASAAANPVSIGPKILFFTPSANAYPKRLACLWRAALVQLAKKNLAAYLGDVTPKQMDRELRSFSRAARILSSDRQRLIDTHPKQWVGIRDGGVCAAAKSYGALIARLKKRGLSPNDTIIRYIDTSGRKLIL